MLEDEIATPWPRVVKGSQQVELAIPDKNIFDERFEWAHFQGDQFFSFGPAGTGNALEIQLYRESITAPVLLNRNDMRRAYRENAAKNKGIRIQAGLSKGRNSAAQNTAKQD